MLLVYNFGALGDIDELIRFWGHRSRSWPDPLWSERWRQTLHIDDSCWVLCSSCDVSLCICYKFLQM